MQQTTPHTPTRSAAWRVVVTAVIGGVALAACVTQPPPPPPPPPPLPTSECVPSLTSAADYNALFDLRTTEWAGADMTTPIGTVPDGEYFWLFGDTFAGRVQPDGSLEPGSSFLRNSLITQAGNCLTHRMSGTPGARTESFMGDPTSWYWPMSGWVDPLDPNRAYVVLMKIKNHDYNGNGAMDAFDFYIAGNRIATVSTDDGRLLAPPAEITGYDDGAFGTRRPGFGEGIEMDANYVYLNGFLNDGTTASCEPGDGNYLARVPKDDPTAGWEFWAGDGVGWGTTIEGALPITFVTLDATCGPSAAIHPVAWGSGWLAVAERAFLDREILAWTAPSPEGPWTEQAANVGEITLPVGGFSYGARLVELPGSGWTLAWNINSNDFLATISNVRLYGPRFAAPVNLPPPL